MEYDSALGQPRTPPRDRHAGIELRHLRYLVAVAEAGTFTQAAEDAYNMVRVHLDGHPLTTTAAVAWSGDLPRHLQQLLFDTADAGVCPLSRSEEGWPT